MQGNTQAPTSQREKWEGHLFKLRGAYDRLNAAHEDCKSLQPLDQATDDQINAKARVFGPDTTPSGAVDARRRAELLAGTPKETENERKRQALRESKQLIQKLRKDLRRDLARSKLRDPVAKEALAELDNFPPYPDLEVVADMIGLVEELLSALGANQHCPSAITPAAPASGATSAAGNPAPTSTPGAQAPISDPFVTRDQREVAYQNARKKMGTGESIAQRCRVSYGDLRKWVRERQLAKGPSQKVKRIEDYLSSFL